MILNNVKNTGKLASEKNIEAEIVENIGTITALENIESNAIKNETSGKIVSGKEIIVKESLENDGILSAKGNLTGINIKNTGNLLSDKDIFLKELIENSGSIEGNNINILNTQDINNDSGEIKVFNEESQIDITASNLTNNAGKIQSQGKLALNINNDLVLAGSVIGNKELNINAKSLISNTDIENNGNIILQLENDFVNNKKFVSGENIEITARDLTNSGTLGSVKGFLVNILGKLTNLKDIVLGSGKNEIETDIEIRNEGFITSQGDLILKSGNLVNSGQIASGKELEINLTEGVVNNADSLIYSNSNMNINAIGNILNEKGEIYSGNNLIITTEGNIRNIVGDIESVGDITINASQLENIGEVIGEHSIKYVSGGDLNLDTSTVNKDKLNAKSEELMDRLYKEYIKGGRWDWFHDGGGVYLHGGEKVVSNYTSNLSYLTAGKNLTLNIKNDITNREGNILAGNDINIDAQNLTNENFLKEVTTKAEWRRDYELHGGAMYTLGDETYYYDGQIYNHNRDKGNVIIKDDITWKVGSDKATKISARGSLNINANKVGNGVLANDKHTANNKNINAGEVSLNENNIHKTGTIETEEYIKIPNGDKGLFKVNEEFAEIEIFEINTEKNLVNNNSKPGFSYLIETNVKFIDEGMFLGSDYFFDKINFNPEKDIRLLGDEFFETKFVNRAILESTGARYLNGAANDKEQMQILYDNSVKAMEDMNLSIGISLTAEQINNLKDDIIWYVEEEVNGVKVLVPKVYLSKETLASLGNNQSGLYAGDSLNISAVTVNNTGKIQSSGNIAINTEELLNKSVLGEYKAGISGNNINIVSVGDISNIGAEINAENNLNLESLKGNIANKTIYRENILGGKKTVSRVENTASITGGNININAAESFENTGALVKAEDNLNISAKDINLDTVEIYNYEKTGGGKNYTITESNKNFGGSIEGNNVTLDAEKNINVKGSNVLAENNLNVKAGENVNITASVDTDYYEKQKSKKKSFGRSKASLDMKYSENINESNFISGNEMNISAGNNINVIGSNVMSENTLSMEAENNIVVSSALKGSAENHQSIKTGFLGLSGKFKKDKEVTYKNVGSYVGAVEKVDIKSGKDITVLASQVESGKDINITAGQNVNIIAGDDITEKESEKHKTKTSIFGGIKDLNLEIGLKTQMSKNKNTSLDTKVTGSSISGGGDINIASGKNINIEASNIEGKNTNIHAGNELNITGRDEIHKSSIKNEKGEIKVTAGINLGGIKDTVDSVVNMVTGIKDVPKAAGAIKDLASGKDINESLEGREDSLNALNNWINGPSDGGVSAGIYAGIEISKDKSKTNTVNTVGSNINSEKDVNLKTDKGDMNFSGTNIYAGNDINIDSGKDINILSGKDKSENKNSSESINGQLNILTGQVSGGISAGKGESKDESNKNSNFYAENDVNISGKDLTVKGGNIEGEHVKIDVDNLLVESVQDKSSSTDKSFNIHGSSDNQNNTSTGAGLTYGKYDKEWVTDQSSIIGRENSDIKVEGNTHLEGGLLGGKDTTLTTGTLTYNDINDHEKGMNIGISGDISGSNKSEDESNQKTVEGSYSAVDREQITHATVGDGTIIVNGQEENPEGLNRDESKAQEITKDVTVDEINVKYDSERREWKDVKKIMSEHGAELDGTFKQIFESLGKEYKYNLSEDFETVWNELELIVGKDLKQDMLGIIPTERNFGGIYDQPILKADAGPITIEITPTHEKELGEGENITVNAKVSSLDGKDIDKLNFGNGILNFKDDIQMSSANQALTKEQREALGRGETVTITTWYNPSHGAIADAAETLIDVVGFYSGGKVGTGNSKKLAEEIRKNPNLLNDYTAHSQGTAIAGNAIMDLINSGDGELLRGKKITFNGSPLHMKKVEELSKEYGFEFEHRSNAKDPVALILGLNDVNTEKTGHINSEDAYGSGYTKTMEWENGKYVEKIEKSDFHNVTEVKTLNGKETSSKINQQIQKIKEKIFNKKRGE